MKIVVVDDDTSQRTYLSLALRQLGEEVTAVANPFTALDAIRSFRAEMLICDVKMPEMDGMELVRRIRATEWDRYIYILMVTSLSDAASQAEALESGADDFMTKPTDLLVLQARLRSAGRLIAYERELRQQRARLDEAYSRLRSDLQVAAAAQRALLPNGRQGLGDAALASLFIPSAEVSGDMFNCFGPMQRYSGFYLADASGHGIRAALSTVALGSMISSEFFWRMAVDDRQSAQPEHAVAVLDRRFGELSHEDSYFAMLLGLLDHESDQLVFCQAGAPSPLLVSAHGTIQPIGNGGLPVGLVADATFERGSVPFGAGDRLVVYSDGVLEAAGRDGTPLGPDGLVELVATTREQPAAQQLADIERRLMTWAGSTDFPDDVSMIILER